MKSLLLIGSFLAAMVPTYSEDRAAATSPGEPVIHRDLPYVVDGHERQKLDLYLPRDQKKPVPLVIWVHGGGWQNGSKENSPLVRQGWTNRGYAVASLNYRLSGHAIFPAQIEDCKAAIRWLRAHAEKYGIDPTRFGVWGSSAGGHLVALLGTSGDVSAFDVGAHLDQSSRVQAVCDYFGPTDFPAFVKTPGFEPQDSPHSALGKLLGGTLEEKMDLANKANPITHVDRDDPPFLILHGDKDPVVPINQSQLLYDALKKAGGSVHFHTIKGGGHGPGFDGPEIQPMVQAFFDQQLLSKEPSVKPLAKTSESTAAVAQGQARRPGTATGRNQAPGFAEILERHDTNQDGKIARTEFKGPPALFDRLDTDKNDFVTREEHAKAFPTAP